MDGKLKFKRAHTQGRYDNKGTIPRTWKTTAGGSGTRGNPCYMVISVPDWTTETFSRRKKDNEVEEEEEEKMTKAREVFPTNNTLPTPHYNIT